MSQEPSTAELKRKILEEWEANPDQMPDRSVIVHKRLPFAVVVKIHNPNFPAIKQESL